MNSKYFLVFVLLCWLCPLWTLIQILMKSHLSFLFLACAFSVICREALLSEVSEPLVLFSSMSCIVLDLMLRALIYVE